MSRRHFLGGAGVAITLPFLESFRMNNPLMADTHAPPKRILFYYIPNGIHMPSWTPNIVGQDYDLPYILEPIAPFQNQVSVLSGLANFPAFPDGPGDHAAGTGSFLTATHVYKTEGDDIQNGISVDQVLANALNDETLFPSIQLGIEGGASVGGCDSGYSCAYSRNISWAGPQTPLPKIDNPAILFDRLFGGFDSGATVEEIERRKQHRLSVLDYVLEEATLLSGRVNSQDRQKLDEYLTAVREVERQIESLDTEQTCETPEYPDDDIDVVQHAQIMTDLMVLAFECDLTRNISFMMANAASNRSYDFLGIDGGHHDISHHQDDPQNFTKLETIGRWEVEQFTYLLDRLSQVQEADGSSLLDNSLVFFSSEIEDGNTHNHINLPVLLAGKAGGHLQGGTHMVWEDSPPIANLFISILDMYGVSVDSFGDDGTGLLTGLV